MNEFAFKEGPLKERSFNETTYEERPDHSPQQGTEQEKADSLGRVWKNRRSIKPFHTQASYFRYLFLEYRKIRYFGNVTHIFLPRIVPSGIQLSRDVGTTFTTYLQPWSVELFEILSSVLSTGWRYLDKKEFNLLVVLKKLCEKIVKTDFSLPDLKNRNLLEKYRSLEMLFLVLHYRQDYPEILISALKRALKKVPDIKDSQSVVLLVRRIINRDDELPSLYNFLLGLNMLKYRRYFEINDLIHANSGEVVSEEVFECEGETYHEINQCIAESRKELLSLQKKLLEIQHLKQYLPLDEKGEIDYKIIEYFYESNEQRKKCSFTEDLEDVVGLSARLLGLFVNSFENILNGKIYIPGVGNVELFARSFFQVDLTKLKYIIEKLGKITYYLESHFTFEQYLALLQPRKVVHRYEAEAKQLIDEGLVLLHDMGNKLERILRLRTPGEIGTEEYEPLEPALLNGRYFHLPFEGRIIRYRNKLGGKTVLEALSFIVRVCYLICMFFHKPDVYGLLAEEEALKENIESKLLLLGRIAKPEILRELRLLIG